MKLVVVVKVYVSIVAVDLNMQEICMPSKILPRVSNNYKSN